MRHKKDMLFLYIEFATLICFTKSVAISNTHQICSNIVVCMEVFFFFCTLSLLGSVT